MIFVSYSRKDESLVLPLTRLLRASGQKVFIDQQDLEYGGDWKEQLAQAIVQSGRLLLFWSKYSESSPFVAEEWRLALAISECNIVPVLLDRTPLPPELERFHGTADMAPLFRALRRMRVMQVLLWLSWIVLAAGLAAVMPVVMVLGPVEEMALVVLNLVPWLVFLALPVFALRQYSLARSRRLYHRLAESLGT